MIHYFVFAVCILIAIYMLVPKSKRYYDKYVATKSNKMLIVHADICTVIKDTKLTSPFLPKYNKGLFAVNRIPDGRIIMRVNYINKCFMNDPLVDLTKILAAKTDREMYDALTDLELCYYRENRIKSLINVIMVRDSMDRLYYKAIKDIEQGEELFRAYGFSSWMFEIVKMNILNNNTMKGFIEFINKDKRFNKDPLVDKIYILRKQLTKIVDK